MARALSQFEIQILSALGRAGRTHLGKVWRSVISIGVFSTFVVALGAFVYSLELDKRLDGLCEATQWRKCAELQEGDCRFWDSRPRSILKQYFRELASLGAPGDARQQLEALEAAGDAGAAADILRNRARTLEYDEYLPNLAEAYIRCSVGVYRHRFELASGLSKRDLNNRRIALVKGLKTLAELYRNHGKNYIADRALLESKQLSAGL
jgi:hypothetical protein